MQRADAIHTITDQLTAKVPIGTPLHERQLLQDLSDQTSAPAEDRARDLRSVHALDLLRSRLVMYRLNYRVVETSAIESTQKRFDQMREVFQPP